MQSVTYNSLYDDRNNDFKCIKEEFFYENLWQIFLIWGFKKIKIGNLLHTFDYISIPSVFVLTID